MKKIVYIFGNPDLAMDSLPITILPELKKAFPKISFLVKDPNEEWDIPEELVIIDTVVGLKNIKVFEDMKNFLDSPRVSMHDFDAYTNLMYLQKLGKLKKIKIIGVPPTASPKEALEGISSILRPIQP